MENIKDITNERGQLTEDERAKQNERLMDENKGIMVCWCCEHFDLCDNDFEGGCKLMQKIVPAFQIVCPNFILKSGVFTKRKIPDYCVNYQNKEHENE